MADERRPSSNDEEELLSDTEADLTEQAKSLNGDDDEPLSDTEAETTELQEGDVNE
jgi:hypothetical protein